MSLVLLLASILTAQAQQASRWECRPSPIPGSVPFSVSAEIHRGHLRTYTTLDVLADRLIPPREPADQDGKVNQPAIALWSGSRSLFNAAQLPAISEVDGCNRLGLQALDATNTTFAVGARWGPISLFYAAGTTASYLIEAPSDRPFQLTGAGLLGTWHALSRTALSLRTN